MTKQQVIQDAKALHDELQRLGVDAGIDPRRCTPGGQQLAFYGVTLRGKTKAADVARILPELQRTISRSRRQRIHLRFDDILLRLEAEHPNRRPLQWLPSAMRRTTAHAAALGVSYHNGEQVTSFSFDDVPQVLVAGETGSGKTVLVRNILLSLAYATSPDDLRIILVDPKNEDLLPYRQLPHTILFAGLPADVAGAIRTVSEEVQARIADPNRKPYRLLLVIDELAQLTNIDGAIKALGEIMSIGRSKLVNCLVCTQQPTEDGGMGSMMKANVPLRLIGAVSNGQSYTATRRKGAGADLLPGNGAFLYIKGMEMYRFQSYLIDDTDERQAIAMIRQRWGNYQVTMVPTISPAIASYEPAMAPSTTSEIAVDTIASDGQLWPIGKGRALTDDESAVVREMAYRGEFDYRGTFSMNRAMIRIYGSRSPERAAWIEDALNSATADSDDKIIRLREVA